MTKKNNKGKNTMKKKIYEYMTLVFAVVGTLAMVSATGAIEADEYLLGAAAALTGIASYVMTLFSQTLYAEAEVREKDTYEDLTQYYVNGGK